MITLEFWQFVAILAGALSVGLIGRIWSDRQHMNKIYPAFEKVYREVQAMQKDAAFAGLVRKAVLDPEYAKKPADAILRGAAVACLAASEEIEELRREGKL